MGNINDVCEELADLSEPEQPLIKRKRISVNEKGVRYSADVNPERNTVVFQIDGNLIKDGTKCDKLILSENPSDGSLCNSHLIELKGSNIKHAIEQLESTLRNPLISRLSLSDRFARVVGRSIPSNAGNPEIERAKARFKNSYKCELKILKNGQKDKI